MGSILFYKKTTWNFALITRVDLSHDNSHVRHILIVKTIKTKKKSKENNVMKYILSKIACKTTYQRMYW